MEEENLGFYKCKECPERFKTTFELQNHKRSKHRISQINKSLPRASSTYPNDEIGRNEPTTGGVTGEITSTPSGRHLTCVFCRYKYDTKDPVVVHLLKLCRRGNNGYLKCPFCVKVKIDQYNSGSPDSKVRVRATPDSPNPLRKSKRSCLPPRRISECELKRSNSSGSSASASSAPDKRGKVRAQTVDTPIASSNIVVKKKGIGSYRMIEKSRRVATLYNSEISTATRSTTPVTTSSASTPAVLLSSSGFNSASVLPARSNLSNAPSFLSGSQPNYDHGLLVPNRNPETPVHRNNSLSTPNGDIEPPRKFSVVINNQPMPESSLTVPKAKDFKKGNFRCEHCSYVGESFRQLQFHINTHLAKSYPCEFCPNIYRTKQGVVQHNEKAHPDKGGKTSQSFATIASTIICADSNDSANLDSTSCNTQDMDSQSSNSAFNLVATPQASTSTYFLVGPEVPRDQPSFDFLQEHREFFMFAKENKVEKVVKVENF